MSELTNGFSQGTVLKVAYSMLGLTSCVVLARAGLSIVKPKQLTASDFLVFTAFACYAIMCALYIALSPYMQRIYDVANGKRPPYPELQYEIVKMTKMIFAAPCMFWMTLWSIKFSLLCLYRRLLVGLPRRYRVIWWSIVGVCLVTFAGNYVFYFRSCGTISGFWTGGCAGNAAKDAQLVSLYYSFTVDTATNIMVMALPMSLTWNLQMPRSKKNAILTLFGTGVICILFACLRVTQVAVNAAKPEAAGQPLDPTWLAIWGMVECSIAVIIGCCPAFAVLINAARTKFSYDSQGYQKHTGGTGQGSSNVQLRTIGSMRARERNQHLGLETTDLHWAGAHSSQEQLRTTHDGILVSTTVTQKDGTGFAVDSRER
ncbi:uncharacterized protein M421DRAFT_377665 [Didymella exigua CBS 183.55]|uniref:Rhodopsin domain-containing protein n=1 Tax=Didymella exigua CBS 183.55 TaxID=1150837 RepID=A0A6A5RQ84_9PLEO|nr:uncharacterized protein M421DRAFT_377665 [Didymella exigua CBS 183.55]KAF1930601.1 hypothetical protein M421DRAFT_377665 [Didymella exigua CBS 183.55]